MSPKGETPNILRLPAVPTLDYMKRLLQRDYNPRPPRSDAQSGHEVIDMNEKTQKRQTKKWTRTDDRRLLDMAKNRVGRLERARVLERTVSACDQRLFNLRKARGTNPIRKDRAKKTATINKVVPATKASEPTPMDEMLRSVKKIYNQNVKQKIVIQDTIDKMEVLLGRLRKVLE